jgi:hypothetical protein
MKVARQRRQLELAPEFVALHDREDAAAMDRDEKHAAVAVALADVQADFSAHLGSMAADQQAAALELAAAVATAEERATEDRQDQRQRLEEGLVLDSRRQLAAARLRQAALVDAQAWVAELAREYTTATAAEHEAKGLAHPRHGPTTKAETEKETLKREHNKQWHWEQHETAETESEVAGFGQRFSAEVKALAQQTLQNFAQATDAASIHVVEVEAEDLLGSIHVRMQAEVAGALLKAMKAEALKKQLEVRKSLVCEAVQRQVLSAGVRLQTMVVGASAAARLVDKALGLEAGNAKFSALVAHIAHKWAARAKQEVDFSQNAGGDGGDGTDGTDGDLFTLDLEEAIGDGTKEMASDDSCTLGIEGNGKEETQIQAHGEVSESDEGLAQSPKELTVQSPSKAKFQNSKAALESLVQVQVCNIEKVAKAVLRGISIVAPKARKCKSTCEKEEENRETESKQAELSELDVTNQLSVLEHTVERAVARAEEEVAQAVAEIEAKAKEIEEQAEADRKAAAAERTRVEQERWWQQQESEQKATAERAEAQRLLLIEQKQLRLVKARQKEAEVEATRREAEHTRLMAAACSEREAIEAKMALMTSELRASRGGVKWLVDAERQRRQREAELAERRVDAVYATVGRLRALMEMDAVVRAPPATRIENRTTASLEARFQKRLRWLLRGRAQPPSDEPATDVPVDALPGLPDHPPVQPPGEPAPEEAHERAMREAYEAVIQGSRNVNKKRVKKTQGVLIDDLHALAHIEPEELRNIDMQSRGGRADIASDVAVAEAEVAVEPDGVVQAVLSKVCMKCPLKYSFQSHYRTHYGNSEERAVATRLLQLLASSSQMRLHKRALRAKAQPPRVALGRRTSATAAQHQVAEGGGEATSVAAKAHRPSYTAPQVQELAVGVLVDSGAGEFEVEDVFEAVPTERESREEQIARLGYRLDQRHADRARTRPPATA